MARARDLHVAANHAHAHNARIAQIRRVCRSRRTSEQQQSTTQKEKTKGRTSHPTPPGAIAGRTICPAPTAHGVRLQLRYRRALRLRRQVDSRRTQNLTSHRYNGFLRLMSRTNERVPYSQIRKEFSFFDESAQRLHAPAVATYPSTRNPLQFGPAQEAARPAQE